MFVEGCLELPHGRWDIRTIPEGTDHCNRIGSGSDRQTDVVGRDAADGDGWHRQFGPGASKKLQIGAGCARFGA